MIENKCNIRAFDPIAIENVKPIYPHISYADNVYQAVELADLIVIMTEWPEFKEIDFKKVKELMRSLNIIDCRNILDKKTMNSLGYDFLNLGNASTKIMMLRKKF